MAIALVGTPTSAVGASTTATTATITVPSGSTGDMLLIGVAASSIAGQAGNAPKVTAASAALTRFEEMAALWCYSALFYRVVQAGDASTYTFNSTAGSPLTVVSVRYSGVDPTRPFRFWNLNAESDIVGATTTSVAFPVMNNIQSTDLVVTLAAMGVNSKTTTISTISTPTGWTSRISNTGPTSSTAYPVTAQLFDRLAATDTPTPTGSTGHWHAFSVALVAASNPVPDSPGGTIAYVNSTSAATVANATSSLAVNVPAGVADGHLMILAASDSSGLGKFTTPTGWTSFDQGKDGHNLGLTTIVSDVFARVWYRYANSEPASYTVTYSQGTSAQTVLIIVAYSGVRAPAPVGVHAAAMINGTATATTSPAPYALPQVSADNLVVDIYASGAAAQGTFTATGPSGTWTQRKQVISTTASAFNASLTVADKLAAADRPTAATSTNQGWVVFTLALIGEPAHQPILNKNQAVTRAAIF